MEIRRAHVEAPPRWASENEHRYQFYAYAQPGDGEHHAAIDVRVAMYALEGFYKDK